MLKQKNKSQLKFSRLKLGEFAYYQAFIIRISHLNFVLYKSVSNLIQVMINFTPKFIKKNKKKIIHETAFDYMTSKVITFKAEQDIREVIETIIKRKISGGPVINDNEEIIGIITEKDCLRLIYDEKYHNLPPNKGKTINYMSKKVITVDFKIRIDELANKFMNSNFRRYPVLKNGKMVGIISRRDILKACRKIKKTTWDL